MQSSTSEPPTFYTPAQLCLRWQVDRRTVDKLCDQFGVRWGWLSPRLRRVPVAVVERIEREKGLWPQST